jgi:hypothetical protein
MKTKTVRYNILSRLSLKGLILLPAVFLMAASIPAFAEGDASAATA